MYGGRQWLLGSWFPRAAWTGRTRSIIISNEERPDEDDETYNDLPTPKLTNFKEAVQSLDDVHHFLESRGYIEALKIGSAVDTLIYITALKFKLYIPTDNCMTTLHHE